MTSKERAEYYSRLVVRLERSRAEDAVQAGLDGAALIKARVQRHGQDAEGIRFSDYSPAYAKHGRAQLGYQAEYKDFTRTGRLFARTEVTVVGRTKKSVVVSIGPSGQDAMKVAGALKQGDAIYRLSDSEARDVLLAFFDRRRKRY